MWISKDGHGVAVISITDEKFAQDLRAWAAREGYQVRSKDAPEEKRGHV